MSTQDTFTPIAAPTRTGVTVGLRIPALAAAAVVAAGGILGLGASGAQAAPPDPAVEVVGGEQEGDVIHSASAWNAEVATAACGGGNVATEMEGGPYPRTTTSTAYVDSSAFPDCDLRARIVFSDANGHGGASPWAVPENGITEATMASDVHRCYTEFLVARGEGREPLHLKLYNPQVLDDAVRPAGCSKP